MKTNIYSRQEITESKYTEQLLKKVLTINTFKNRVWFHENLLDYNFKVQRARPLHSVLSNPDTHIKKKILAQESPVIQMQILTHMCRHIHGFHEAWNKSDRLHHDTQTHAQSEWWTDIRTQNCGSKNHINRFKKQHTAGRTWWWCIEMSCHCRNCGFLQLSLCHIRRTGPRGCVSERAGPLLQLLCFKPRLTERAPS